jgi:hypothetical protein
VVQHSALIRRARLNEEQQVDRSRRGVQSGESRADVRELADGVTVAQQILVLLVLVRIQVGQLFSRPGPEIIDTLRRAHMPKRGDRSDR